MKKWIFGLGMGLCLLTACGGGANKEEAKENSQTATEAAKAADKQEGKKDGFSGKRLLCNLLIPAPALI